MNPPNHPDEIWLGRNDYSFSKDWSVNGWLLVAALISGASDILFPSVVQEWPLAARLAITAAPFLAIALWARSLAAWIHNMDELHRRIVQSAVLFAVGSAFFIVTLWHRMAPIFFAASPGHQHDIATIAHIFLLLTFSYFLGYRCLSRRYL